MKTVIMAGGKGTRIAERFPDIPKPLIPIKDKNGIEKPVLEWELLSLRDQGFTDILITVSHMADKIQAYFGDGSNLGMSIEYFVENVPLGNAGALFKVRDWLGAEPFLLLNADAVFDIDFNRFTAFHEKKRTECDALVTLFTHPNSHPYDSGLIVSDENGAVSQWLTKEDTRPEWYKNRVNAGLHVIDPKVLENIDSSVDVEYIGETVNGKVIKVDLDRQILKPLCGIQKMFCYDSPEYVKDMGTPERYEQVCRDFQAGTIEAKNLKHPQKAIFLDRDGTINKYVGFLRNIDQFELIDGVAEAIKKINESGYLCIVVTNQPVIARGEVTTSQLQEIHNKMETLLGKAGAYIDGLYYCPHHPDKGFEGEVVELKIDCECRKPKPGMLLKAAQDFNIDLSESWMVGDGENDVKAGFSAGCHTVLLDKNDEYSAKDFIDGLDFIANKLLDAFYRICE
ncbi:MAG: D-glycero-beta-D-manno-heptose 1,7-bisphosphate 7-phosphatase [Eubacterium sp.]|nr:D-glycero-beta-D-manno-heptose 1,7-bisphosphate 7-phosphatase [Eubacterium sp.]